MTDAIITRLREKIYYPLMIFLDERIFHFLDPVIYWMENNERFCNQHVYWFLVDRQEELAHVWLNKIEPFLDRYFEEEYHFPWNEILNDEPYNPRF